MLQQSLSYPLGPIDSICEIILYRFNGHQNHAFDLSSGRALKIVLWTSPVQCAGASLVGLE